MVNKIRNFYFNKYVISPFKGKKYYLSYDIKHKALWYRVYKVGTRTIDYLLKEGAKNDEYIYSSKVGYTPSMYHGYFKFAFVRNPIDRFISSYKNKILKSNYFGFSEEVYEKRKDFNEFINWAKTLDITNCDEHLLDQCSSIDLNNVDFIGRFENFTEDLNIVAHQLGLPEYKHVHLNKSKDYVFEVTEQNKKDIAKIYERDIRTFYPSLLNYLK